MQNVISPISSSYIDVQQGYRAVKLASSLCKRVQNQLKQSETVSKLDTSPVTIADYGAQALVTWSLLQNYEDSSLFSMIAEEDSSDLRQAESKDMLARITQLVNQEIFEYGYDTQLLEDDIVQLIDMGGSQGGKKGRHWVLDPIDGTRGFVGMRQYAVCLGLLVDGVVKAGVLGCPNLPVKGIDLDKQQDVGVAFVGSQGEGAFTGSLFQDELPSQRIKVREMDDISTAILMESYESRHSNHNLQARMAQNLGIKSPSARIDSQCKYGALSRGDGDIFLRFMVDPNYREKIWDHAAGVVILQEAGGRITDLSGNSLNFSEGRFLDIEQGIVASASSIHSELLKVAKQTMDTFQ
eukprot:TRINITY_DN14935_c0_g1_i1.p1 TRINITY_DN14935_c0_g1~~TRINITY_DN14935_c0_g1_i1.p1  ORF type:complete len:360 (-),score=46.80 TRINITY_DN14935_c0_g1_i1:155-1213(-)